MVGEFPELQGVMGRYYALHDGESAEVAAAIAEQYLPRFAGDALPTSGAGLSLAIADKLDTLVGIFAIGQKPTGTKDPYGLRRAALGVLRILIETRIALDLRELIRSALDSVRADLARLGGKPPADGLADEIYGYMMERLRAWYLERGGGVTTEMFDAVLDTRPASPLDFEDRLRALAEFLALPDAAGLTAANKRIANILKKAGELPSPRVDPGLLTDPNERKLAAEVESLRQDVERLVTARRYADALTRLASLRGPLDAFFENVMVMADDVRIRANRLALLAALQRLFLHIANLSRLPG
jgi:glycyl-tRNA synthetase beta chain